MNKYKIMGRDGNITVVGTELTLDALLEQLSEKVSFVVAKKELSSGETVILLEEVEEELNK